MRPDSHVTESQSEQQPSNRCVFVSKMILNSATGSNLELLDVVGCHVQADSYGDEYEADDEEGGQHGPRGQDGLPGR